MPKYEIVMPTVGSDVVINYPSTGGTLALEGGGGGGGIAGTNYIYVAANGTDTENATELQAAYNTAKTLSPSSTNRITIVAGPGKYNFGSSTFTMDTQYIDLVSLDGNRSVVFNAALNPSASTEGSISITANDVFVKGIDAQTKNFTIATNLNLLRVENCKGGDYSFGGDPTFGSNPINVSGAFMDCSGGSDSFASHGIASGTFIRCTAGLSSFGRSGTASGIFQDCVSGGDSFGAPGIASGTFINCTGADACFGGTVGSTASGKFFNCTAGSFSFGGFGTASGTFTDCTGGEFSFGASGTASGEFRNCTGDSFSFGSILTGELFYCRLTSGTFQTPTSTGKIVLCIDGSDNIINAKA